MRKIFAFGLAALLLHAAAFAESLVLVETAPRTALFKPDARSVQRSGPAYRYPQAGWIVLHIEGEPYERGLQHGKLLSPEIVKYVECLAAVASHKDPSAGWRQMRTMVNALFVRKFEHEYLEEMQGIADGASGAGGRFDGRPIDLVDVVALNVWAEIMTLDGALSATPTGLEGIRFPDGHVKSPAPAQGEHCSAFAATAPATADGKIVFGHISMYELYPSSFFNVWIDLKPAKGNRILMQTVPGGIQSGLDYYLTSAGMLVSETTIQQTRFNAEGQALTSQIRKAVQYGDSIDSIVAILDHGGNGLYSNEWLIADIKTNEIAMFELGTHTSKLYRSSKHEWFGGTEGFYWGCNNVKDRVVRLETQAGVNDRPVNVVYHPKDRDRQWVGFYQKYKGRIDANFGHEVFSTGPIASFSSVDAKYTTSDAAQTMTTWALFGPPLGRAWRPEPWERANFPAVQAMVSNPWTQIGIFPPAPQTPDEEAGKAVDLGGHRREAQGGQEAKSSQPAWHGTILAKSDGDLWLATAFADYEHVFNQDNQRAQASDGRCLCAADKQKTAGDFFGARSKYMVAAQATGDVALSQIAFTTVDDNWYRIASGKGLLLLHELRAVLGDKKFADAMDAFGTQHAGKEVSSGEFVAHMEAAYGKNLKNFFDYWLNHTGLPRVKIVSAEVRPRVYKTEPKGKHLPQFVVAGTLSIENGPWPAALEATVETAKGEATSMLKIDPDSGAFEIESVERPTRFCVDKYNRSALANGNFYKLDTFMIDPVNTLIVYGTEDDAAENVEAAEELQLALIKRGPNVTVPLRSDKNVTGEELKTHHILLVGGPGANRISREFAAAFPVEFGSGSFKIGGNWYAHPGSALAVAAANPRAPKFSAVLIAGLSSTAIFSAAPRFGHGEGGGDAVIFEHGGRTQSLVLHAKELEREFGK